jgi:hypothetical protein
LSVLDLWQCDISWKLHILTSLAKWHL